MTNSADLLAEIARRYLDDRHLALQIVRKEDAVLIVGQNGVPIAGLVCHGGRVISMHRVRWAEAYSIQWFNPETAIDTLINMHRTSGVGIDLTDPDVIPRIYEVLEKGITQPRKPS